MIFHRLAVSHFKGIKRLDIAFAPKGITLIEGRNEIGKSSLVHALTTLFEEPVSRTRRKLEHLIPNDGSGTPEILLEAESGEYRFVYRKSYIENKIAELLLHAPSPERFEGVQAQERFEAILNETLDRSLWKALMLQQGSAVGLPEVEDQQALMTALDNAVAVQGGAPDAESLFARIGEERHTYYHAGHSGELQRLRDLRNAVQEAETEAKNARDLLAKLDDKIVLVKKLRHSLKSLNDSEAAERRTLADCEARLAAIETREKLVREEKAKLELARQRRASAERDLEYRKRLIDAEAAAAGTLQRVAAVMEAASLAEADTGAIARDRKTVLEQRSLERMRGEKTVALRRADCEHLRDALDLEQMRERKSRIDASAALVLEARAELAANQITAKAAKEIRDAEDEAARARIRRDSAVPKMRLDAIAPCGIVLDGAAARLAEGETREMPVTGTVRLELPGVLSVAITAGDGAAALEEKLADAEETLRRALAKYGIENPGDAPRLFEKRREAERRVADHKRVEEENLRDLAYSDGARGLVERIAELEAKVAAYERARPDAIALPPNFDQAKAEREKAENDHEAVLRAHREAGEAWTPAEAAWRSAKDELIRLETEKGSAERELARARQSLEEVRGAAPDERLEREFTAADTAYADAARAVAAIEMELRELDPERTRERYATIKTALARTMERKTGTRDQIVALEAELEHQGGDGLHERLEEADIELEHRNKLLAAEVRRAEAANLLYGIVSRTREQSQKAYRIPLKKRIEELAKSIYSENVGIELTDKLQIASRVMDGRAVDFAQLSGGAREQFSLIHRAACSLIVSRDGGVPLILDDALGYSDAERLIGMNEVLSRAAQKCQIIVLTCDPRRFAYIEPAVRINLEEMNG